MNKGLQNQDTPHPSLKPGEIVAFSVSREGVVNDFYLPTFRERLDTLSLGTYLGVVLHSQLKAAIVEDEDGNEMQGTDQVEVLRIQFIAPSPPDASLLQGNEKIISFLPDQSYSFASLRIHDDMSGTSSKEVRQPLRTTGDLPLPFHPAFAYTMVGVGRAHLGQLHRGKTGLSLAPGELARLEEFSQDDSTVFAKAHERAAVAARAELIKEFKETAAYEPSDDGSIYIEGEDEIVGAPKINHVVLDVWTDWQGIRNFAPPSRFEEEKSEINQALESSFKEEPALAIDDWVGGVTQQADATQQADITQQGEKEEQQRKSSQQKKRLPTASFAKGLVTGIGVGVAATVLFLRSKRLRRALRFPS